MNGIMKATTQNLEQQELSWADQCMFLKAYCCEDSRKKEDIVSDPRDPRLPPIDHMKTVIAAPSVEFTILPNPSRSGELTVRLMLPEEAGPGNIRLVDAAGQVVLEQQVPSDGGQQVSIDVSALAKGVYMMQVLVDGFGFSRKVVLER